MNNYHPALGISLPGRELNAKNRLNQVFAQKKAFIPFITAGDPSLEITKQLVLQMAEAGAALIELGVPFSDPVAEGPVIQEADHRALAGGTTTDKIFDLVGEIRKSCPVPLALMTYINPVFTYGIEEFMGNCRETGIDAVIVPDIPYEEREELLPHCLANNRVCISMIAPTSKERIRMIVQEAQGFVYCVSSMGVTGVRREISNAGEQMIKLAKEVKDIPCALGFGIAEPEQAKQAAQFADGVIVGSAIVKIIAEHGTSCVPKVAQYVRGMVKAVQEV